MKIKAFKFSKKGAPKKVTVELTMEEAAFIAKFTGTMNMDKANAVMRDGYEASYEIFDCMVGDLFNRFYYNGVDGYLNGAKPGEEKM